MREKAKEAVVGLLAGLVIGAAVEGIAALAGGAHGGAESALRWAQIAGLLLGVAGAWMLARRLSNAKSPRMYRPGRTALEMEYEVRDENIRREKSLRESSGEAHRMPWRRGNTALWMDIGMVLSALLPMLAA